MDSLPLISFETFTSILDLTWVMPLNQIDPAPDTSYEFADLDGQIVVVLHSTGVVKVKDSEILVETDSLEVHLPSTWESFIALGSLENCSLF